MAFYCADNQAQAYQELWDEVPGAVRAKGFAYVVNDVFGFLMTAALTVLDEVTFIYRNKQVRADKLTGTGEAISHGQKVYATLGSNFQSVTANPTGTIGTDYYFVGIAKKDAGANEATVLIDFWGDEYDHADRAA
jgi:hypothetical protein